MVLSVVNPADLVVADDLSCELLGGAVGDDPPVGEDDDAIGEHLRLVKVVGGDQDRCTELARDLADQAVELTSRLRVEPGRRLVEEEQLGTADETERDVESAPLAAREHSQGPVCLLGQSDCVEELVDRPRPSDRG